MTKRPLHTQERITGCTRGAALVEFALVAPLFLMLLLGVVAYGGYFWRAHALQQVANDAARAAVAGLTMAERRTLIDAVVSAEIAALGGLAPEQAIVTVEETNDVVRVELSYDATEDMFFHFGIVPMPDTMIRRRAAVRLGGM